MSSPPVTNSDTVTNGDVTVRNVSLKHSLLIDGVLQGKSGASAAINAGYSPIRAKVAASEVLHRPDVQAELQRRRAELAGSLEDIAKQAAGLLPGKLPDANADTLSKVVGRSIESAMLLRGEPTSITASVNVELSRELLGQLAGEFGLDADRLAGDLAAIDLSAEDSKTYSVAPVKNDRDWS